MIYAHLYQTLHIPSHRSDGLMIYAHVYPNLLFLQAHVMVLWLTHMYIKPYLLLHANVIVLWYMHTYIKPYLFLHAHVMVLWYTHTYIKPYYSFTHTWWSYDIRPCISKSINPSCTRDGLMIYAHVYQTQSFLHAHVMVLWYMHMYINILVYTELVNASEDWTVLCWSLLGKDCLLGLLRDPPCGICTGNMAAYKPVCCVIEAN